MVSGYHGKYDSVSYYVDDTTLLGLLDRGDVFSVHVDKNGYIDSYIENRDYSTSEVWELAANLNGKSSYCQGVVEKNDAANHRLKIQTSTSPAYNVVRTKADSPVCIYDSETGRIYRATVNDIERGDRIFVKTLVSNIVDIVIFR